MSAIAMEAKMKKLQDEQGFVLVAALMVMLVLTIIGISATTNTSIELQIAGNDKVHKKTFYEAEAGAMLGSEVLEQNFSCTGGFTKSTLEGTIHVNTLTLSSNDPLDPDIKPTDANYLTARVIGRLADADVLYPWDGNGTAPTQEVGYLFFGGQTEVLPGGALEMSAGYEGKGKSSAQGGVAKKIDIYSQFKGLQNSESIILFGWRHLVGTEGSCNPNY